jgi:hypothetical protein
MFKNQATRATPETALNPLLFVGDLFFGDNPWHPVVPGRPPKETPEHSVAHPAGYLVGLILSIQAVMTSTAFSSMPK